MAPDGPPWGLAAPSPAGLFEVACLAGYYGTLALTMRAFDPRLD